MKRSRHFILHPSAFILRREPRRQHVDQALSRALHFVAVLALIDYNKKHADAIQLQAAQQDKVEVRFLFESELPFPPVTP